MAVAVKRSTPPGPGKRGAWKNIGRFLNHRAEFLREMWEQYGDFCHFQMGPAKIYLVSDPELVKEILLNHDRFPKTNSTEFLRPVLGNGLLVSGGDYHARQRRLLQPAFNPKRVASYGPVFTEIAKETSNAWHNGDVVDIHSEMMKISVDGTAKPLFGKVAPDMKRRIEHAFEILFPIVDKMAKPSGKLAIMMPTLGNYRFYRARAGLNEIIYELIEDAKDEGERSDLLSMLVRSQDSEGDGGSMSPRELRDELMTLLMAGLEATALVLTWTWYLLAQNPNELAKLQAELDSVLGGRVPTMDDLPKLEYLRRVVAESMRIYSPSYIVDRMPTEDWPVYGYVVPKGSYVFTSQYIMHRHPKYFPDPMRFDPDRWSPEETARRPRYCYFPFGGGERVCIGEFFARAEIGLVLATLLQRWTPELVPGQTIGTAPVITVRPDRPILIRLQAR